MSHDSKGPQAEGNGSQAIAGNLGALGRSRPAVQLLLNSPDSEQHEDEPEHSPLKMPVQKRNDQIEVPRIKPFQLKPNNTGLPDNLKSGAEALSGFSLDDVQVHYNSDKPAQLQALAYAQGSNIFLGPGQQRHLPHEAWHVVQQKQGRVHANTQLKGMDINTDPSLEAEADVMGSQAMEAEGSGFSNAAPIQRAAAARTVQRVLDVVTDAMHHKRKAGVEITEEKTSNNKITKMQATPAWAALGPAQKSAAWKGTISLPDRTGAGINWYWAPPDATMLGYFIPQGGKDVWMRWGNVACTEDHGEFEWIISHPGAPVGVTEYRDRLVAVSKSRQVLRNALNSTGWNSVILSMTEAGGADEVVLFRARNVNKVSSQITFETTDKEVAKNALQDGLTYGLDRATHSDRTAFPPAPDQDIARAIRTTAGIIKFQGVDLELVMSYIFADMCHKIATLTPGGPGWSNAGGNWKGWRVLFPKSHPYHILELATDGPVTVEIQFMVYKLLNAVKDTVVQDVLRLFTIKLMKRGPQLFWENDNSPAFNRLSTAHAAGADTADNLTVDAHKADIANYVHSKSAGLITNAFDDVVAAITDNTKTAQNVVKSGGFAQHGPTDKAFAFEDRAEVEDAFPDLRATYERIKALVDRY